MQVNSAFYRFVAKVVGGTVFEAPLHATSWDSMQADRDQTAIDIATAQSDLATQIGETASDIAEARTDLAGKVTAARAEAAATLVTITDDMTRALNDRDGLAAVALVEMQAEIDAAHSDVTTARDKAADDAKDDLKDAHKQLDAALVRLADLDTEIAEQIADDQEAAQLKRDMRGAAWATDEKTWGQKFYLAIGHAAQWATQRIVGIQLGLDGLGLIPIVGNAFDGINVGISVVRGNWGDAGVNVVAMAPIIGQGSKGGKLLAKFSGPLKAAFGKVKMVFGFADEAATGIVKVTPSPAYVSDGTAGQASITIVDNDNTLVDADLKLYYTFDDIDYGSDNIRNEADANYTGIVRRGYVPLPRTTSGPSGYGDAISFPRGKEGVVSKKAPAAGNYSAAFWFRTRQKDSGICLVGTVSFSLENGLFNVLHAGWPSKQPSGGDLADGQWHHVAFTWNQEKPKRRQRLYVDGKLVAAGLGPAGGPGLKGQVTLGRANKGGHFIGGSLDEFRIYSRRLTDEEVQILWKWQVL